MDVEARDGIVYLDGTKLLPNEARALAKRIRDAATIADRGARRSKIRPEIGKRYCMIFGSLDAMLIIQTPDPSPRWRDILSALRPVLRQHDATLNRIQFDFLADRQSKDLVGCEEAFAGSTDRYHQFWLYAWRDDAFHLVRPPAPEFVQSSHKANKKASKEAS